MKLLLKSLIILLLFTSSIYAGSNTPEINLSADIKPLSNTSYSLEYNISVSGIDTSLFKDEKILCPYEPTIIEGMVLEGKIVERDFLYSERNIDLNADGDTDDFFTFIFKNGSPVIAGKIVKQLFSKSDGTYFLIPLDNSNRENIVKLQQHGQPFVILNYDSLVGRIKAGLSDSVQKPLFKEFPNSLVFVEIIQNNDGEPSQVTVNGNRTELGTTNERDFSFGGENLRRYYTGTNIALDSNKSAGSIRIDNVSGNFKVRVRYLFSISSRTVLMKEKILTYNKK